MVPGKRVLCNMVPVLGFRRGRPYLTLGAPGGRAIVSAIPQVLATLVDRAVPVPGGGGGAAAALRGRGRADRSAGRRQGDRGVERRGHAVAPKEETFATLQFAKPVGIRVTDKG